MFPKPLSGFQRYTTNGLADSTFGNNGYTITTFDSVNIAYSVLLQKDEKIVLGGATESNNIQKPSDIAIVLARYNNDLSQNKSSSPK